MSMTTQNFGNQNPAATAGDQPVDNFKPDIEIKVEEKGTPLKPGDSKSAFGGAVKNDYKNTQEG